MLVEPDYTYILNWCIQEVAPLGPRERPSIQGARIEPFLSVILFGKGNPYIIPHICEFPNTREGMNLFA